jgi:hypothetical protein
MTKTELLDEVKEYIDDALMSAVDEIVEKLKPEVPDEDED